MGTKRIMLSSQGGTARNGAVGSFAVWTQLVKRNVSHDQMSLCASLRSVHYPQFILNVNLSRGKNIY